MFYLIKHTRRVFMADSVRMKGAFNYTQLESDLATSKLLMEFVSIAATLTTLGLRIGDYD